MLSLGENKVFDEKTIFLTRRRENEIYTSQARSVSVEGAERHLGEQGVSP